jgi:predicted N-acetyltransferase YhbS
MWLSFATVPAPPADPGLRRRRVTWARGESILLRIVLTPRRSLVEGPRAPRPEEIDDVTELISSIFRFGYYDPDYRLAAMRRPVMQTGRVIMHEGKPVSYIYAHDTGFSMCGCPVKVTSIGCVCTAEAHRNQGLANAILTHQIERAAAAGVRLMIVSGGRGLYRRHHCVPAGLASEVKLRPALFRPSSGHLSIRRVTLDDWPILAPLYQDEPAHFIRPADLEQNLCFWWNCHHSEIYLVEDDNRPVAYAALSPHRWSDEEARWVSEYAGSRAALLDAMPLLFDATGVKLIAFAVLAQDRDLQYRFQRLGLELNWRTISGTMRIINLPGLMSDLKDYLAARLLERDLCRLSFEQDGETCIFRVGEESVALDLSAAAHLVCGGPEAPEIAGDLGRVLSAVFPLPTIQPGFNYA